MSIPLLPTIEKVITKGVICEKSKYCLKYSGFGPVKSFCKYCLLTSNNQKLCGWLILT
jgi:hypothetical protein